MGKISSYTRALVAKLQDVFVVDQTDNNVTSTKSVTVEQIGDAICGEQVHSDLKTDNQTIIGGINELAKDKNIADEYDDTHTYNTGAITIYGNTLYICTANNTTGDFDPSKWTATTIDNVIGDLSSLTTSVKSSLVGAVNEVNSDKADKSALTWTLLGETIGTAEQSLPANWNELQIYGMFGGNAQYGFTAHAIKAHWGSNPARYIEGGADKDSGTDHHIAVWHIGSNAKIGLDFWRYNNTDYTSTSKLIVYYR